MVRGRATWIRPAVKLRHHVVRRTCVLVTPISLSLTVVYYPLHKENIVVVSYVHPIVVHFGNYWWSIQVMGILAKYS